MPETVTQTTRIDARTLVPSGGQVRPKRARVSQRDRFVLFFVGDFLFLTSAAVAATVTMHMVHRLEWPFIPTSLLGMIAAMLIQTLMAFVATPLLGSIECMVPSMIVGMVAPMTICVLHLFGCESTWSMAIEIGAVFAFVMFAFLQFYGRACAHFLTGHIEPPRG